MTRALPEWIARHPDQVVPPRARLRIFQAAGHEPEAKTFPLHPGEPIMRTLEEIRNTPVGRLSDDEINLLDSDGQRYARLVKDTMAREAACPGHERIGTASYEEAKRGWHRGCCKHCGKDMSYDSGD